MKYFIPLIVASAIPQFWRFMTWQLEWTGQNQRDNMDHAVTILLVVGFISLLIGFFRIINN